jgi:ATP-dependent helicase/nuclease subunit A
VSGLRDDVRLREVDAEARRVAQREFQRPLVLEAGAGTGKTATLVARVAAWCLTEGWTRVEAAAERERDRTPPRLAARVLERVVAITFTEAAAAEMAARIEQAFSAIEAGDPLVGFDVDWPVDDPQVRDRARALRGAVDHLVVQTIHAWCRRILASHPLDAGLHPGFEVDADGSARRAIVREVLETRLREAYAPPCDRAHLALVDHGVGPGELEDSLLALVQSGASADAFARDPLSRERIRDAMQDLEEAVRALSGALDDALDGVRGVRTQSLLEALAKTQDGLLTPPETREALVALQASLREGWDEKDVGRLHDWARGKFKKGEGEALGPRALRVAEASATLHGIVDALSKLDVEALHLEHRVLAAALQDVEALARARGRITFEGLLESTARLLAGRPDVAATLRRDIDQLLVDEFQDTDRRQCEIVAAIALAGPVSERPGLFLVGDPKQSIYGWRSADLAAYEAFRERVSEHGGSVHPLSVNHRSVPAVLDEVERVVAPVMLRRPGLQPAFEPLVASEARAAEPGYADAVCAPVEHWLPVGLDEAGAPRKTSAAEAARLEAEALARDLCRLHEEGGVGWKGMGVLFRSRADWDVYLTELRRAGVPFSVEGDRSYFRRREIVDAAALVRCVMDPGDTLALVTALRSSVVGVPDAALAPLHTRGILSRLGGLATADAEEVDALAAAFAETARSLPSEIPGLSRIDGWERNAAAFAAMLGVLRCSLLEDAPDRFVEKLRQHTLLEPVEASRFLGAWRAANLERFFHDLARELADGRPLDDVLRGLRDAVAEEEPREEGRLRDLEPDAVRILTIHGAKGLAFDHVYLMQLQKGVGRVDAGPAVREVDGRLEARLGPGRTTLGWHRAHAARSAVAEHERVRMLYVALTRARDRVVVVGLPPAQQRTRARDTHAELLTRRVPALPDLPALVHECRSAAVDRQDVAAARFVLPALGEATRAPRAAKATAPPTALSRVAADAAKLRAAAEVAELRMARPFGDSVSREAHRFDEAPDERRAESPGLRSDVARAAGSAVHRALEVLDLHADPGDAFARAAVEAERWIASSVERTHAGRVRRAVVGLLDDFARGSLCERLFSLADCAVARELPLLLAPGPDEAAIGFVSGAIDLLYRDPKTGGFVVVDFKTDRLDGEAALQARAADYAVQGDLYTRAVRDALGLAARPRFELWFLAHDRCIEPRRLPPTDQLCFDLGAP